MKLDDSYEREFGGGAEIIIFIICILGLTIIASRGHRNIAIALALFVALIGWRMLWLISKESNVRANKLRDKMSLLTMRLARLNEAEFEPCDMFDRSDPLDFDKIRTFRHVKTGNSIRLNLCGKFWVDTKLEDGSTGLKEVDRETALLKLSDISTPKRRSDF